MSAPEPEEMGTTGQHGLHRTAYTIDYDRGVIVCGVCGKDGATIPPEWYEHDTDVEGEDTEPATDDAGEPLEPVEEGPRPS